MQFACSGNDAGLRDASAFVASLTNNEDFWARIAARPAFRDTSLTGGEIATRLRACDTSVAIAHWRPIGRPRTVAVTDPGLPYRILYNMRNFAGNSTAEKVHTVMHEFVHNVDLFDDGDADAEYTHETAPYSETAPYWIGDLAQSFYVAAQQSGLMPAEVAMEAHAPATAYEDDIVHVDADEIDEGGGD